MREKIYSTTNIFEVKNPEEIEKIFQSHGFEKFDNITTTSTRYIKEENKFRLINFDGDIIQYCGDKNCEICDGEDDGVINGIREYLLSPLIITLCIINEDYTIEFDIRGIYGDRDINENIFEMERDILNRLKK